MLIKCDSRLLDIFDRANLYDLKNNMDKSNIFTLAIIIQNLQWQIETLNFFSPILSQTMMELNFKVKRISHVNITHSYSWPTWPNMINL